MALFNTVWFNPSKIFERKFHFKLPESARIENHDFQYFYEERLMMKVSFDEGDYECINDNLRDYFGSGNIPVKEEWWIPSLWDMDKKEITDIYFAFESGKFAKTRSVYAFITKNSKEQYSLYVIH